MARVSHTAATTSGKYPTAPTTVTATAADTTNKEQTELTGREIIIFRNSGASTRNVTITSTADDKNRTGDVTFSLAAGAIKFIGPLGLEGWRQSSGVLYFEADHAEVLISVLRV
jgi:hypothetical protein